jgi:hypothetical protein
VSEEIMIGAVNAGVELREGIADLAASTIERNRAVIISCLSTAALNCAHLAEMVPTDGDRLRLVAAHLLDEVGDLLSSEEDPPVGSTPAVA